ncbi:MAG: hypothetical protein AMXMBFR33_42300 [Candidatus Xenobia bacterium]
MAHRTLAALLLLGVVLRLALAAWIPQRLLGDAYHHVMLAHNMLEGHGFSHSPCEPYYPDISRPPLMPIAVTLLMMIPVPLELSVVLFQSLLTVVMALLVYSRLRKLGGEGYALLAVSILVLNPYWALFSIPALNDVLSTVLLTAVVEVAWRCTEQVNWRRFALLGVLSALLSLTKPTMLPFAVVALLLATGLSRAWRMGALAVLCWSLCMVPWAYRNYQVGGRFTPMTVTGFGYAIYIGVTFDQGVFLTRDGLEAYKEGLIQWSPVLPGGGMEDLPPERVRAVNNELTRVGIQAIKDHPGRYALHVLNQAWHLWWDASDPLLYAFPRDERVPILVEVARGLQRLVLLLALAGLVRRFDLRAMALPLGFLLCLTTAYSLLHVETRYTLPAAPLLSALAAGALTRLRPAPEAGSPPDASLPDVPAAPAPAE